MIKKIRKTILNYIPQEYRGILSNNREDFKNIIYATCGIYNKYFKKKYFEKFDKLHLGCGDIRLKDFINVDYRVTVASDMTMDCSDLSFFPDNRFALIYSNAFLEHLYLNQRLKCLENCYRILNQNGILLFTGIPDFREIAKAYLKKAPGVISKTFDLFEVYRLTHGDPEQAPKWWLEQLHKSLFDKGTIEKLLQDAGFKYYHIFNYCYRDTKLPVNLGMIAFKNKPKFQVNKKWIISFVTNYNQDVNPPTIKIIASN